MYRPDSWRSERARLAYLTRHKAAEADITEARRNYRALRLADHIEKWLAADPPLSTEQCERIAELILAGSGAK